MQKNTSSIIRSFNNDRELTYLSVALMAYREQLLKIEPDGWHEDLLMMDWLIKKVKEVKAL